ncbi:MAG: sugar transferase, partial [Firmicutes bacterium]|nr:sugar transferase [Bacillota bacterium]
LSLDELPQIFNVLSGSMSLVGPRPYLPREKQRMGTFADTILMARPGITGLWQVSGRNDIDFDGRLFMEAWYVRNWSLWLDITLLIRTVGVVLARRGAY